MKTKISFLGIIASLIISLSSCAVVVREPAPRVHHRHYWFRHVEQTNAPAKDGTLKSEAKPVQSTDQAADESKK